MKKYLLICALMLCATPALADHLDRDRACTDLLLAAQTSAEIAAYHDCQDADRKLTEAENWQWETARKAKEAAASAIQDKRYVAFKKAAAVRKAKPGVSLGQTAQQVKDDTQWGAPASVNRTVTGRGVFEQWVYDSGGYLYFTNGILTAVQN